MIFTYITLALMLFYVLWHYQTYNSLIQSLNAIDQTWSNIEVELKRRLDLIANLVQVVKGYSRHEAETLEKTVQERAKNIGLQTAASASSAEPDIKSLLGNVLAIAESYPDLKANQQFLTLQNELSNTENRIAERRNVYNQAVSLYSNQRLTFPLSLIANVHQFGERLFFDLPDEQSRITPDVSFK